jgi:hypothetical protein
MSGVLKLEKKKSRRHFKVLGARRVNCCKFRDEKPQTLRATVQNLVTTATWRAGFVHP